MQSVMSNRIKYPEVSPAAFRALIALQTHVRKSGLDPRLENLVYLRVSQLNGCAYCTDMHDKDLRADGETAERLAMLVVWREAHNFSARERCAFAWAEAVTLLGKDGVPDDVYEAARSEFGETGLVELTLAVATINAWNRMGIAFRAEPGKYQPAVAK
jgi:AhpD family alkylhydroperoxidase